VSEHEVLLDIDRGKRLGLEEAIFCRHKSTTQLDVILGRIDEAGRSCLLTHLSSAQLAEVDARFRASIDYDETSKTAFFRYSPGQEAAPEIGIVTAGSSDVPVAKEAQRTLEYFGVAALPAFDVGVAGLWRLLERVDELRELPVVIAVAGMDAALPSVLGGLYPGLIVAVPTSVGYGVATGGTTALNAILASCASGIVTVNIDNGYGAACAALRVLYPQRSRVEKTAD
jgi:NCAIR mutase (PurE)-related protein